MIMEEAGTDVIQGTLDKPILKVVSLQPMHAFGIARRAEQVARGVFRENPGSLMTVLQQLGRAGWVHIEFPQTENSRRARFYSLIASGKKQLAKEMVDWTRPVAAVARFLGVEA